ncbi:MAG: type I-E CRISPR-associated protein Cas6/Cse3/CasE [Chthoniobacteraceae bacterium]|nr:type I-E CRISPR-associated protein Cas6/Cse3/CasE [Chthoniobacteraceae bacterium]
MSLYLTEIQIDYETAAKAGLRDTYAWHKKTWLCFPGREEESRDFLTRLDPVDCGYRLLILSSTAPQRPPWCPEPAWRSKAVPETFLEHSIFHFSLLANPTRKTRSEKNGLSTKNGRRVPIVCREDVEDEHGNSQPGLLSWFARKAEASGFAVDPAQVRTVPRARQYFIKNGTLGLHSGVEFQGILRVTDPEKFRHAFINGIGSAKAFGFGMLVLAPQ